MQAFDVSAVDYLGKPVMPGRGAGALERLRDRDVHRRLTRLAAHRADQHWSTLKLARLLKINHNHVACAWAAREPRSCSASTRRPIFTRWIGWFRSCRCRRDVRNTTGLSITATRTLSLFAASNTRSGEVLAQTVPRHTSATFVAFLGNIVTSQPSAREIHVIVDNFAIHRTQAVGDNCT
jgi:DDE superfamily endonuclease